MRTKSLTLVLLLGWIGDVSADGKTVVGSVQLAGDVAPLRWLPFVATLP